MRNSKGQFKPGNSEGGRTKGSRNRLTKELKGTLKEIIDKELERVPELLEEMEPRERMEFILKLLPYVMPKVAPTAYHLDEPLTMQEIKWPD